MPRPAERRARAEEARDAAPALGAIVGASGATSFLLATLALLRLSG